MTLSSSFILKKCGRLRRRPLSMAAAIAVFAVLSYGSIVRPVSAQQPDEQNMSPEDIVHFLKTAPLFSALAAQHPAFRKMLKEVLGRASLEARATAEDEAKVSSQVMHYLAHYIARSSDIAVEVYAKGVETVIAMLNHRNPTVCQELLRTQRFFVLGYTHPPALESLYRSAHQLILHAVATPHTPPSRPWVERTLRQVSSHIAAPGKAFGAPNEMSCNAYLAVVHQSKRILSRPDYFHFLRGLLSLMASRPPTQI